MSLDSLKTQAWAVTAKLRAGINDIITQATIEGIILGVFDMFTIQEVYSGIQEDIDLWTSKWGELEDMRDQLQNISLDPKLMNYMQTVTVEDVLAWLRHSEARPDIASIIINTPNGVQWLEKQLQSAKNGLKETITLMNNTNQLEPNQNE